MLYEFPGMIFGPQTGPRDEGKQRKHQGARQDTVCSLEYAESMKFTVKDSSGADVEVLGTLLRRPNRTYLGHQSDIFETPWRWEDRWTGNDPHFRRIPAKYSPSWLTLPVEQRRKMRDEIVRLAAIENPGRCAARRRWVDGWCGRHAIPGGTLCNWHSRDYEKEQARKNYEQSELERKAEIALRKRSARF